MCTCIIYTQVHSWNDDPQRNHIFLNQGGSMNRKIRLSIFIESSPFSKRCRACRDLSEKDGWAMCVHVFCVWCGRKWDRDSLANVEHVCPIQSCSGGCFSTEMPLRAFFASQHTYVCKMSMMFRREHSEKCETGTPKVIYSVHRPDAYCGRKDLAQALYSVYETSSAIE